MDEFPVRTPGQLPGLLQAFRQQAGLTQRDAALRLGVTQQTYSALERKADNMGAGRLLALLNLLGVELVLRRAAVVPDPAASPSRASARKAKAAVPAEPDTPAW